MSRCLYCYGELDGSAQDFHAVCARKMFGTPVAPLLPFAEDDITDLAATIVQRQTVVTGVQPKLSLHISRSGLPKTEPRFTIVGLWGGYILKPPSSPYPELPEIEDLTMHLANAAGIATVPHCLVRLQSGTVAYLSKRVDRKGRGKLAMEDMCQLTERMTEHKYRGSYEQVGRTIQRYSATPGLDVLALLEVVLFCYLTGNADMHLKNFSLLETPGLGMTLAPAYDLVNTILVNPADTETLALTLHGKKKNITRRDFIEAMKRLSIDQRQQESIFATLQRAIPSWKSIIDRSFIRDTTKARYNQVIDERSNSLGM